MFLCNIFDTFLKVVSIELSHLLHFSNHRKYLYLFLEIANPSVYRDGNILIVRERDIINNEDRVSLKVDTLHISYGLYIASFQCCSINNINAREYVEFSPESTLISAGLYHCTFVKCPCDINHSPSWHIQINARD